MPSPLARSISQPVLDNISNSGRPPQRRSTKLTAASLDPIGRQSLDLQMLISNKERKERRSTTEIPRNNSDSVSIPRHLSMGPTIEVLGASASASNSATNSSTSMEDASSRNRTMTTSHSSASLQEMAPRHSTSSISSNHSTLSFSGSSTVSSRFSRIWSGGKDANGSNWSVGEFAEASGEAAAQGLVRGSDQNRNRNSMLNRLSGIWSRR